MLSLGYTFKNMLKKATGLFELTLNRPEGEDSALPPPGFSKITFLMAQLTKQAYRYVNKILFYTF